MKGIKIELLGIATILLGVALTTNNFFGYVLGVLGFGIAVAGCFLKDKDKSLPVCKKLMSYIRKYSLFFIFCGIIEWK